jgi:hypothetical protein
MKSLQSMRFWGIVVAMCVGLVASAGLVQGQLLFEPDHLKCYRVLRDQNPNKSVPVDLFNRQFGEERECRVNTKAALLCAPTVKVRTDIDRDPPGNDPRGGPFTADDYLCYPLKCPRPATRQVLVDDQFGRRQIAIRTARLLCTPVDKIEPPPIECNRSGPPVCGGICPDRLICRQTAAGAGCGCVLP